MHARLVQGSIALVLMASVASSGCTIAARKHRGLGAVADALAVSGVALVTVGVLDNAMEDSQSGAGPGDGTIALGGAALLGGALLGLYALGALEGNDAPPPVTRVARPAAPPASPDADLLHLAELASAATAAGDCKSAQILTDRIGGRDRGYRDAVVASGAVAPCVVE